MTSWQYEILALPEFQAPSRVRGQSASVTILDKEGAEGWEAVGMTALTGGGVAVLLKRPGTSGPGFSGGTVQVRKRLTPALRGWFSNRQPLGLRGSDRSTTQE